MVIGMKRKTIVLACLIVGIVGIIGTTIAASTGPASDAGDCVSECSGSQTSNGPNGEGYGPGPAPNSGDGNPDGPGWE